MLDYTAPREGYLFNRVGRAFRRRLSKVFSMGSAGVSADTSMMSDDMENSGLVFENEESRLIPPLDLDPPASAAGSRKRFIDLWPIQMMTTESPTSYAFSFDTYTLILQMGCILSLNSYWRRNYCLRVVVFVENQSDVDEEVERVGVLLKGLRIQAEVKPVWLHSEGLGPGLSHSVSREYTRQMQIFKRNRRFAMMRNKRRVTKKNSRLVGGVPEQFGLAGSSSAATAEGVEDQEAEVEDRVDEHLPPSGKEPRKKAVKQKRSFMFMGTRISRKLLRHYESTDRDDLPRGPSGTAQASPRSQSPERDFSASDADEDDELQEKEQARPDESDSIFNTLEANLQHKIMNELISYHSSDSAVIFRYWWSGC